MSKSKILFDELIEKVKVYDKDEEHLKLISKAYDYAYEKHLHQKRITGEAYINHPLNVALILTEISSDYRTICAALLHDTIEDCDSSFNDISEYFDSSIAMLVESVTKINKISFSSETEQVAANQRKILVGLAEDARVLVIKLADRLHNMRTLYVMPVEKQKKKAKETLEILTPVAHRLGIYKIKSELEDLSLRYLKPDVYYDIVEKLNLKKAEREEAIGRMISEVSSLLDEHNIKHEIKGRSKGIYSIYNKMNKGRRFEDIYDILALRILTTTKQNCYLALGLIHSKYKPVSKRFKDYIAMPKTNLYQSLHTTVFGIYGQLYEIQIRTYEMDEIAEYGIASHFSYKENKDVNYEDNFEQKLHIFRNIIELNEDTSTPVEFINSIKKDILINNSIYVYTPKGDVLELPEGATVIDFAYKVHSEIGNKVVGATVNDNIVSLNYKLKTGDIININTSMNAHPSRDWLKFVVTSHAKNKIRAYYSKITKDEQLSKGMEMLERELRRRNIPISDVLDKHLDTILHKLSLSNIDELYISLGSGKNALSNVIKIIIPPQEKRVLPKIFRTNKKTLQTKESHDNILVEGQDDIKTIIAQCCKPVYGDKILGYVTKGSGIMIHRCNCPNIANLDERIVEVKWNSKANGKYYTDIIVYTSSEDNLLNIATKIGSHNVIIDRIETINKGSEKIYNITLLVTSALELESVCKSINSLKFVKSIKRSDN